MQIFKSVPQFIKGIFEWTIMSFAIITFGYIGFISLTPSNYVFNVRPVNKIVTDRIFSYQFDNFKTRRCPIYRNIPAAALESLNQQIDAVTSRTSTIQRFLVSKTTGKHYNISNYRNSVGRTGNIYGLRGIGYSSDTFVEIYLPDVSVIPDGEYEYQLSIRYQCNALDDHIVDVRNITVSIKTYNEHL